MLIRERILEALTQGARSRLERLQELTAPEIMVKAQRKKLADLEAGELEIGGDPELLELEFSMSERKVGRGGKPFVSFYTVDGRTVNFFPNARHGMFISEQEN